MDMSRKQIFAGVGVVAVGGSLFWLVQLHGYEKLVELFSSRPTIEIRSATRPTAMMFFTGEKLRFVLRNANATRVFWLFDEKDWKPGRIEIEYSFTKDPV